MRNEFIRQKWEVLDGRRVRLRAVYPKPGTWPDAHARPPILLIHGLGCSAKTWEPTLRRLAALGLDRPVYAVDMPGYGRSGGPHHAMNMDELADWTIRLLDVLGVLRVHAVGNSMGCQVALALARRHPSRVGALVLQGPTTGRRFVPTWRYLVGTLADVVQESLPYNLRLAVMYTQMGPVRYLATVRAMLRDDPFATVADVKAPCLVIRGGHDLIVSDKIARKLTAALPNAVYTPLDSAAHAIEFNNPDEFTATLLAFLARAEAWVGQADQPPPSSLRVRSKTTASAQASTR